MKNQVNITFKVSIINCAGLRGIIEHCYDDNTYAILYNDGRKILKFQHDFSSQYQQMGFYYYISLTNICVYNYIIVSPPPGQNKRPRQWDIIAVASWTEAGAVDGSHVNLVSSSAETFVATFELGISVMCLQNV